MPRHAKLQEKQAVFGRARSTSPFPADDPRLAGFQFLSTPTISPALRRREPMRQQSKNAGIGWPQSLSVMPGRWTSGRFKNMLAKKGQGSAYQRILHTMELARQSKRPWRSEAHGYHECAHDGGTMPQSWNSTETATGAVSPQAPTEARQPSILRRLNAEPTGRLSEFDRERIGVLSADVHGRIREH